MAPLTHMSPQVENQVVDTITLMAQCDAMTVSYYIQDSDVVDNSSFYVYQLWKCWSLLNLGHHQL